MNKAHPGFILVISVMVISTILILIAVAAAFGLVGSEERATSVEHSFEAQALAEGCADVALLQLALDGSYTGNETIININGDSCSIRPIISGATTIVETEATVNGSSYRLSLELSDRDPITITKWQRVSSF